jgi:hypothetical protein
MRERALTETHTRWRAVLHGTRTHRVRVTSVAGALASLALVGGIFLRWLEVKPEYAHALRAAVKREVERPGKPTSAAAKDYGRLAETLVTEGGLTGLDLWLWTRSARAYAAEIRGEAPGADTAYRRGTVAAALLVLLAVGSLLLAGYFLGHRLHRARTPALILSMLVGSSALILAGLHDHILEFASEVTSPGPGFAILLGAGAMLALAGIFGVTAKNWWRAYAGTLLTGTALVVLAWGYLEWGILP